MRAKVPHCALRKPAAAAISLALSGVATTVQAAPSYVITDLGVLDGVSSTANAINDAGQVTGSIDLTGEGPSHAFFWQNGVMTDITPTGATSGSGNGINSQGDVVITTNGGAATFVRQSDGTLSQIPNTFSPSGRITGNGINAAGQIVGAADIPSDAAIPPQHAFLHSSGSVQTDLTPADSGSTVANAINTSGQVVGGTSTGAFFWRGTLTAIPGTPAGAEANAINNFGQVVGGGLPGVSVDRHAFLWQEGEPVIDLGSLAPFTNSTARGINDAGQVVGTSANTAFFAWGPGTMLDLNSLRDASSTDFSLLSALAINRYGQIVGEALVNSLDENHAFLATPTGTVNWIGADGAWDDAANWEQHFLPSRFLDTVIASSEADITVTGPTADTTVNSLTLGGGIGTAALNLAGGGLAVNNGLTVQANGTLNNGAELTLSGTSANAGAITNSSGILNQGTLSNSGTFTNQATGTLTNSAAATFTNPGTLINGGTLGNQGTLNNRGTLDNLAGASLTDSAGSTLTNGGTLNNFGAFTVQGSLSNTGTINNGGTLEIAATGQVTGTGTMIQDSGNTSLAGSLQATLLDIRNGTFNFTGTTLQAGQLNNGGTLSVSAGTVLANMTNTGTVNVTGGGTRVFTGDISNQGTFKITNTTVQYEGTFQNDGRYESDPSTNRFNDLSVGPNGYLVGGADDTFVVTGNFRNSSVQNTAWSTGDSTLVFSSPTGTDTANHSMELAGADRGAKASGANNNFAWGSVRLDSGNSLSLADGNGTRGAALYVRRVVLPSGVSQLNDISSDYNVYFDPSLRANRPLLGGRAFGGGTGRLLPWSFVPDVFEAAQAFGLTPNQQSFAAALDEACTRPTGELAKRCIELQALAPEEKSAAVASLTPDQVPSQAGIGIRFRATRMDGPLNRLSQLRSGGTPPLSFNFNGVSIPAEKLTEAFGTSPRGGGASADGETSVLDNAPFRDNPLGIFVQARFNFGDNDYTQYERGFDFETRSVTIGADYRFTDELVSGLAFNYTSTSAHYAQASGNLDSDTFMGAFYGTYTLPMDFYVDWLANYGGQNYTFNRQYRYPGFVSQTSSRPSGDQFNVSLSSGKDFAWQAWQFSPYIRAEYTNLSINAYEERNGAGLQVNVAGQTSHSFVSDLGLQVGRTVSLPFGVVTPAVRVEWEHQYLNDNRGIGMRLSEAAPGLGNFTLVTGTPDRDYINLGGSVSAALPYGGAAFVRYETRLGQSSLSQHLVELGIRMQF